MGAGRFHRYAAGSGPRAGLRPTSKVTATQSSLYTSGTTGQAKAVRVTQDNLAHRFPHQCINHRIPPYGCTTVAMPLSFVAACMDMVQAHLYAGSTVVFHEYFEAELLLRTMDRWHPNFVWMTTPMIDDVASLRKNLPLDLPYLTTFHHGASMLPEVLTRRLFESVGERLMQGYGMTEYSGGIVTATGPRDYRIDEDTLQQRLKTIGRSVIGSDLALVDPSGKELPTEAEVEGEIGFGPRSPPGYRARESRWLITTAGFTPAMWLDAMLTGSSTSGPDPRHHSERRRNGQCQRGRVLPQGAGRRGRVAAFGMSDPRWG